MIQFADEARIEVCSGKGGNGCIAFRREKYIPLGGPSGGDGGRGGAVIFCCKRNLRTLAPLRYKGKYKARNGGDGEGRNRYGKDGEDVIIPLPPGTVVRDWDTNEVVCEFTTEADNEQFFFLKGGKGGWGNMHFKSSTNQAPKYAHEGKPGETRMLRVELSIMADIGLVGLPNAGKSTLLTALTRARPKIADYPFTTLHPNLGVASIDGREILMADIPGLIEGASEGVGLGHEFLRHIERTRVLVHIVDVASTEGRDPLTDIRTINAELSAYDDKLDQKPQIIIANKVDAMLPEEAEEAIARIKAEYEPKGIPVYSMSAVSGQGVKEILYVISDLLQKTKKEPIVFEKEFALDTLIAANEPFTVNYDEELKMYVVEGPRIEKMLGYTNIDSEKGFEFFQKFLKDNGILDELEALGIEDGDTVKMYGLQFDYYK